MAKQYFIWKNAQSNEWLQITGREFYALVNSTEGKRRYFIHIASGNDLNAEPDDIYMEATLKQYKKHRGIQNHTDYINRFAQDICVTSLDQPVRNNADVENSLHEILPDEGERVDDKAIKNVLNTGLRTAMKSLSEEECQLVDALFTRQISQEQTAMELGITQQMVSKLKKKIIKKLKFLVVESEKSQQ